jgi:hypothetical protein
LEGEIRAPSTAFPARGLNIQPNTAADFRQCFALDCGEVATHAFVVELRGGIDARLGCSMDQRLNVPMPLPVR